MKIAFFSDIHANLPALEAFFEDIEIVNPDAIYCLGDLVGYNIWPNEVVAEIRKRRIPVIMGNHDEALLNPIVLEDQSSNRGLTRAMISENNRNYLINLPRHLSLSFASDDVFFNCLLVHGSVNSINDYMVVDYPEQDVLAMMNRNQTDVLLCGHTHKPFHRRIENNGQIKHVINIGSIGKPKDGDTRGCYALVELSQSPNTNDAEAVQVSFRRVAYDVEKAARAVEASKFDNQFAEALRLAR
ncbi:hypothetical protein BFP72_07570 [Reichenbachiella sp. 5M10]|uniref:metallophosphoesterase family protein n=1 Tax=Reichenbachiella sp. 5M10 TaxID=1889772 RepID=UPI000C14F2AA|nr:metallophosphoesterase family protein [Reichenbachiella sp. 5M10]PIB35265.1 hypothetical protein BFP72_07570 [Reichenbachiella sp. 5M10]